MHKKFNKILQEPDWSFVSFRNLKSLYFICSNSFSFVIAFPVIGCHSLSFVITRCYSLSLVVFCCHPLPIDLSLAVILCNCCHSLSLAVPLVVIRCTARCHSLSLVVICCHSLHHSLSLDIPLLCFIINDPTSCVNHV